MATDQLAGLPSAADFADIEVPEFPRKYTKRQGPASTKQNQSGRTFSASGPKADLIAKMIFADMGLTRSQMATIAKCSPSRVSEVIWAMEAAVKSGKLTEFPPVPTKPRMDEDEQDGEEPAGDDNAEPTDEELSDDREVRMPAELAEEIRQALQSTETDDQ
jgi:hypothetical protein